MSDIAPTAALLSRTAPQAVSHGVPATVSNPPPALAQAAVGSFLKGVVTDHDDHGHPLLRTSQGTLVLNTRIALETGSQVTLELRSAGAQLHVAILEVNGRPISTHAAPATPAQPHGTSPGAPQPAPAAGSHPASAAQAPGTPSAHSAPPPAIEDVLALGQRVRGVVQAAESGAVGRTIASQDGQSRLSSGTLVQVRIVRIDPPAPPTPGTGASPQSPSSSVAGVGAVSAQGAPISGAPASAVASTTVPTSATTTVSAPSTVQTAPVTTSVLAQAGGAPVAINPSQTGAAGTPVPGSSAGGTPAAGLAAEVPTGRTPQGAVAVASGAIGTRTGAAALASTAPGAHQVAATGPQGTTVTAAPQATATPSQLGPPAAPGPTASAGTGIGASSSASPSPLPSAAAPVSPLSLAPSAPVSATPNLVSATVTQVTATGQTLVTTPFGSLALDLGAQLPPGTWLQIEIAGAPPSPSEPAFRPAPLAVLQEWSALEDALRTIMETAPAGQAETAIPQGMPQPGGRLASGLLFFLSALASGDFSAWLGQKSLETLNAIGRGDLVSSMSREFAQVGRLADAAGGDWRFVPLPLFDGQQVQPIRFFFRHGRAQGRDAESSEAATRFIVEVELTRLGDLQLDGLVRARHFDLILRSRGELPQNMRRDIAAIFQSSNEITGSNGQIAFQAGQSWDFLPLDRGAETSDDLVI